MNYNHLIPDPVHQMIWLVQSLSMNESVGCDYFPPAQVRIPSGNLDTPICSVPKKTSRSKPVLIKMVDYGRVTFVPEQCQVLGELRSTDFAFSKQISASAQDLSLA